MEIIVENVGKIQRLNLERTLTQTLSSFREYLFRPAEEIDKDTANIKDKLSLITNGMEERDVEVLKKNLKGWNKEDLLDTLYELEYRRFMDIKTNTEEVFNKYIAEYFRTVEEDEKDSSKTIYFGMVGTVIDVVTLSKLDAMLNKINKLSITETDVLYFNTEKIEEMTGEIIDGVPQTKTLEKSISVRGPIEVEINWLKKLLDKLTGDDTEESRRNRRRLKYHRSKLVIHSFTYQGKGFRATDRSAKLPITLITRELFENRISSKGNKYFIDLKVPEGIITTVNMALFEIFYISMCHNKKTISKNIENMYPVGTLVLYTFSEILNGVTAINHTSTVMQSQEDTVSRRGLNCHSFGKALVTENDIEKKRIKVMLVTLSGTGWVVKEDRVIKYDDLYLVGSTEQQTESLDTLFLPNKVHNNQKGLIPAAHSWDFIHPEYTESLLIPEKMFEIAKPLHWLD